jgi:hypothetical protein
VTPWGSWVSVRVWVLPRSGDVVGGLEGCGEKLGWGREERRREERGRRHTAVFLAVASTLAPHVSEDFGRGDEAGGKAAHGAVSLL